MSLVTGKNCLITIGAKPYEGVTNNYELAFDTTATEYQTLAGPLAGPGSETGTLTVVWAYDSGETDSLFDALWTAADAGTPIAYVATVGKSIFTGDCVAARPNVPADAEGVSECSVEMALDGIPVKTAVAVALAASSGK
jgi:hypothetical protein